MEHVAHLDHLRHDNDGHLPQPPQYEYLNRRSKPFPWGPNSLFFNPEVRCPSIVLISACYNFTGAKGHGRCLSILAILNLLVVLEMTLSKFNN
jgi:hypothetical protein